MQKNSKTTKGLSVDVKSRNNSYNQIAEALSPEPKTADGHPIGSVLV